MTEQRFALIEGTLVVNVILWDSLDEYHPANGLLAVQSPDQVVPGWTYNESKWTAPTPPPAQPVPTENPAVTAAKESAKNELMGMGVSETNARLIVGLPSLA